MPPNGTNDAPSSPDDVPATPYPEAASLTPARRRTFRALRHPNYRLYFAGQLVSLTGSWVQTTALMWLAFYLTGETRWPALVSALQIFPTCFLGVWGGYLSERWPRRHLIRVTQTLLMLNALFLAGLVLSGTVEPWHLVVIATAGGLVNAVDLPARLSFIFDMVGREDLLNAVALNSLTFNLARALGPAIGALLLFVLGPGPCFLINGLSYLAVLAALTRMRITGVPLPPTAEAGAASVREVFRFLAGRPTLALLLVLVAVVVFFGWPTLSLLPALAQKRFPIDESLLAYLPFLTEQKRGQLGYGLLLSGVGVGALLAALTIASYGSLARGPRFISFGVVMTASALLALSLVRSLPLAVGCCVLVGYGLILFMSTSQAVVQLSADDHNRGRIMGVWSMVLSGAQPLGNLLLGPAADARGEPAILGLQALGITLGALGVLAALLLAVRRREW